MSEFNISGIGDQKANNTGDVGTNFNSDSQNYLLKKKGINPNFINSIFGIPVVQNCATRS